MKIHNNRKEPSNPNITNTIPHSPKKSFLSHGKNLVASFKAKRLAKNEEKLSKIITKREYYCSIPNPTKKNRKQIKHLDAKQLKLEKKNEIDQTKIAIQTLYNELPKDFLESDLYKDFQKFVQNILSDKDHIYNSTIQKYSTLLEKKTITKKELAILIHGITSIEKINNNIKNDISIYSTLFSAIPNLENTILDAIDILKKSEDYLSEIEKDNSMHPLTRLLKTSEIRTQQRDIQTFFSTALVQFMNGRPQDITFPSPNQLDGLFIGDIRGIGDGYSRTNGIRMRLISPLLTSESFNLFTKKEQTAIIEALTDNRDATKNAALLKTLKECTVSAPCQKPIKDIVNKHLELSHNEIFEKIQKFKYADLLPSISSNMNYMEEGLMTMITDKINKFKTAQSQLSTFLTNNPTPKRPSVTNDPIADNDAHKSFYTGKHHLRSISERIVRCEQKINKIEAKKNKYYEQINRLNIEKNKLEKKNKISTSNIVDKELTKDFNIVYSKPIPTTPQKIPTRSTITPISNPITMSNMYGILTTIPVQNSKEKEIRNTGTPQDPVTSIFRLHDIFTANTKCSPHMSTVYPSYLLSTATPSKKDL